MSRRGGCRGWAGGPGRVRPLDELHRHLLDVGGDAGDAGQRPGRGRCVFLEHPGRSTVPAPWAGLGGGEFINHHVWAFCNHHEVQLTRGRPHKKDNNTHVEQKNWTHIRPLVGRERIDTGEALELLNDLYRHEWRWMMNLFPPKVA